MRWRWVRIAWPEYVHCAYYKEKELINKIKSLGTTNEDTIKVHINTLRPYNGYGGGDYIISAVKQIEITDNFTNVLQLKS